MGEEEANWFLIIRVQTKSHTMRLHEVWKPLFTFCSTTCPELNELGIAMWLARLACVVSLPAHKFDIVNQLVFCNVSTYKIYISNGQW